MIQSITSFLQNFFLNPLGFTALLALIPLIIFYLTRPEPERKVMPSMEFFSQEERESMLQNAIKTLKSNLILLINIFAIILMTSAVAGLYMEGSGQESSVVVYDRSASMIEEHASMISMVQNDAASEITLVEASDTVEVHEGLNRQEAVDFIRDNPPGYFKSDMGTALQQARQHEGELILLSNLDESESLVNDYREFGANRGLKQIDYSTENRWGFTEVGEDFVEVRNYGDKAVETSISVNGESQEVSLEPRSNNRINLNLTDGRNTVELQIDSFEPDNTAYIYRPDDEALGVEYYGSENRYLDTALELIEGLEKVEENGEMVILDEENSEVFNDDRPKVLMQGSSSHWETQASEDVEVEFTEVNAGLESEVYDINASENSLANPGRALFVEEETVYYNFEDSKIRQDIMYPVLWKNLVNQISEPPNFQNLNHNILFSDQSETGFSNGQSYNFFDQDQADTEFNSIEQELDSQGLKMSQASLISLLVLLLITGETLLILNRGVYH
ncbi:MAG: BatA and WFA domain-containing protein [Candidatus Nanohaloarchaea archaeon]